jgi:hypothetical protein
MFSLCLNRPTGKYGCIIPRTKVPANFLKKYKKILVKCHTNGPYGFLKENGSK